MSKRARWAVAGALVVGLAMCLWLLLGDGFGTADDWTGADDATAFTPEDALDVEAGADADRTPSLAGRTGTGVATGPVRIGDVMVLVVGPTGVPLPEVHIEATPPEVEPRRDAIRATTLEDGRAKFHQLPWDGSWTVRPVTESTGDHAVWVASVSLSGNVFTIEPRTNPSVAVTGPRVKLVLREGLPLSVEVVSADTGFVFETGPWAAEPDIARAKDITLSEAPVKPVAVEPGGESKIDVYLSEFAEHVYADARGSKAWISPRALSLEAEVPLRREAGLLVSTPPEVEVRVDKDWQVAYVVGGRFKGKANAAVDAFGRLRVFGVPFLPGERVILKGTLRREGTLSAVGQFGRDGRDDLFLEGRFQPFDNKQKKYTQRLQKLEATSKAVAIEAAATGRVVLSEQGGKWALDGVRISTVGGDGRFRLTGVPNTRAPAAAEDDEKKGALRVELWTPRGKPAAGAIVQIGQLREVANTGGVAFFSGLDPGKHELSVVGAGASFVTTAEVVAKQTTRLELTGSEGGRIDVEAVDENGDPLPYATVRIEQRSALPYADVELGVQRVDPFTDHMGRRELRNVEPGAVSVEVEYGARKATLAVVVVDGDTVLARVVLTPHVPPTQEGAIQSKLAKAAEAADAAATETERAKIMKESGKLMEAFEALKRAREAAEKAREKGR